VLDLSRSF